MKIMKPALLVICMILSFKVFSQTSIIAAKSHSGKVNATNLESENNFGIIPPMKYVDTIILLTNSSALQCIHYDHKWWRKLDTIYYDAGFSTKVVDSLREEYPGAVFIGFDKFDSSKKTETGHKKDEIFWLFNFINKTGKIFFVFVLIFPLIYYINRQPRVSRNSAINRVLKQ